MRERRRFRRRHGAKVEKQTNDIEIIAGVSFAADFAGVCPDTSVMSYSAYDVASDVSFMPDKRHTVVVREIDNRLLAGDVKLNCPTYTATKNSFI